MGDMGDVIISSSIMGDTCLGFIGAISSGIGVIILGLMGTSSSYKGLEGTYPGLEFSDRTDFEV
jgi:hypothetical protein